MLGLIGIKSAPCDAGINRPDKSPWLLVGRNSQDRDAHSTFATVIKLDARISYERKPANL